jgi:hypothetical protein
VSDTEESSTTVTSVTPTQNLSTTEQGSTVTDTEESSTSVTSVTPTQNLSTTEQGSTVTDSEQHMTDTVQVSTDVTTQQDQLTTGITTAAACVPLTTKPHSCNTDIDIDTLIFYLRSINSIVGYRACQHLESSKLIPSEVRE